MNADETQMNADKAKEGSVHVASTAAMGTNPLFPPFISPFICVHLRFICVHLRFPACPRQRRQT
jgi:hypothetical protein